MAKPPKRPAGAPLPVWANPVWRADWYRFVMHEADIYGSHKGIIAFTGSRAHRDYGGSWEAHETTAMAMGCSERTVGAALKEGVRRGYLRRTRRKHDTNIYEPAMPVRFGGAWPTHTDLERQLIADLKGGQGRQPTAEQGGQGPPPIAEGDRQPIADESLLRTPLIDDPETHHRHHPQQDALPGSDWPSASVAEQARMLCGLAKIEPTPELLRSATAWLPHWHQRGHTWAAVQIGVLIAALNKVRSDPTHPVHSFAYFQWEVPKVHAQQIEGGEFFDAESMIRQLAQQLADRASGLGAAA